MKKLVLIVLNILLISIGNLFSNSSDQFFTKVTDSRDRVIELNSEPLRVVSLAPSITEIMFKIGAGEKLVGRTDYCLYPSETQNIPSIGSLWQPNIEKIVELNPDIIIASTHFSKELLAKIESLKMTVVIVDASNSIDDIYKNILTIGKVTNREINAEKLINDMKNKISLLTKKVENLSKPTVYYVISYGEQGDFTAGGDTFISELITLAGGNNIAKDSKGWSYSLEKIIEKNPSIIICSKYYNTLNGLKNSSGYKLLPAIKNGSIYEIDNNLLDIMGPRIVFGLEELIKIIHPEL